jgi:chemotaxis signal transduction protein
MSDDPSDPGAAARTSCDGLRVEEELVTVRAGAWRLLVPLRHVERVVSAAMPAARPALAAASPVVALGDDLVPVVFAEALLGAPEVRLAPDHQMVLLGADGRRALLWVDAVEDVVPHAPATPPPGTVADLVVGWSGKGRPLAVLDVPRVLALTSWRTTTENA